MALALKISATINDTTNKVVHGQSSDDVTTAADFSYSEVKAIGTTEESIALPADLTGAGTGFAYIKNMDATNYVQIGTATTVYWARLKAGEHMVVALDNAIATIYLKANTAACNVRVVVYSR